MHTLCVSVTKSILLVSSTAASLLVIVLIKAADLPPQAINPDSFDHPVRVACVGDSITMGIGTVPASDKTFPDSYPSQLQGILGAKWEVKNFGVGGRTLIRKADPLDVGRAEKYNPDVVIIALGTNDSKPYCWGPHKDEFIGDYTAIIKSFQALPSHPKVWICDPTPSFPGNWGISETVIAGEIIPKIAKISADTGVPIIDLHTALMGSGAQFADKVHPNKVGAGMIAATVAKAITGSPE